MSHTAEETLYYLQVPADTRPVSHAVEFLPASRFLEEEDLCKALWGMISEQFKTRSKFLAIWPSVRHVAIHRRNGDLAGFALISAPVNWQVDYVTVSPQWRGLGIATALVNETMNQAGVHGIPYVMLSSRAGLRPLYEGECGFSVVGTSELRQGERLLAM